MADPIPTGDAAGQSGDRKSTSVSLLRRLQNNEEDAWPRLHFLYGPLIEHWCRRRGLDRQDVEDVRQQVYQVVVRRVKEFRRERPGDTFRGWLCGITRHRIWEHRRKARRQPCGEGGTDGAWRLLEAPDPAAGDEDDPEDQKRGLLHRALELIRSEFSGRDWQVFRL